MAIKSGNVKQSKCGTVAVGDTAKALFTLPANAMIVGCFGFGTAFDAGTITLYARPINSSTATSFATFAADGALGTGLAGSLTGVYPFARQSVPVVITATVATAATGGPVSVEVTYL